MWPWGRETNVKVKSVLFVMETRVNPSVVIATKTTNRSRVPCRPDLYKKNCKLQQTLSLRGHTD